MPQRRVDRLAIAVAAIALLAAVWTVLAHAVPVAAAMPAVLVPALFVLAGALGPVWTAARFTCRALVAVGTLHLLALAASAAARTCPAASAGWHAASLLLFAGGFLALLPLAAGYPAGPPPKTAVIGQTNAVIAQRLHLSLSAVEKHSTAIFTKLGLPPDAVTHRRVAAVVAYLRASAR